MQPGKARTKNLKARAVGPKRAEVLTGAACHGEAYYGEVCSLSRPREVRCGYTWVRGEAGDSLVRDRRRAGSLGGSGRVLLSAHQAVRGLRAGRLYLVYRRHDGRRPVL